MRTHTSQLFSLTRRGSVTRLLTVALATCALALAQTTPGTTPPQIKPLPPVADSNPAKVPEAVIKTDDAKPDPSACWLRISGSTVNVRSRPDVNSLSMTRLERDTIVWGIKKESGWWAIAPPPDVFSLIAARLVERTGADRGIVKVGLGSTLRVRAGSCNVEVNPQETDVQARIGNGQEVRIKGEVSSGTAPDGTPEQWFKIVPPEGVAAYISIEYAEPITEDVARARGATKPGMTIPPGSGASKPEPPPSTLASGTPSPAAAAPNTAPPASSPAITTPASETAIIPSANTAANSSLTKVEDTSRSTSDPTPAPASGSPDPADGTVKTTTIIPVTPAGESTPSTRPAPGITMEPSKAESSDSPAFDVEGILRPSWKIPAGQFGLRYKLCNPTNPNLVRGYAEFPFDLQISPTQYIGKYVGVIGDRYMDVEHEVPIYRAKRLTVLSPDRAVNRPREPREMKE